MREIVFDTETTGLDPLKDFYRRTFPTPVVPEPATIVPIEPGRYWDTRADEPTLDGEFAGTGRMAARAVTRIDLAGRRGVPADATGVVANLTAIAPGAAGHATLFPCSDTVPTVSTVNYTTGAIVANNAIVPLSDDGAVCVYTHAAADFALDVNGFVSPDSPQVGMAPGRYLDTRAGAMRTFDEVSQGGGQAAAGTVVRVQIAGRGQVPADATAAIVNVTAVQPAAPGHLTLYPCDATPPTASTVNYSAGQVVPNGAVVDLSDTGELCIYTHAATDLLVDVTGYVPAGTTSVVPLSPARLHDSRSGRPVVNGVGSGHRLAAREMVEIQVTGRAAIPTGASAAFLNVIAVTPDGPGYLTLFPCTGQMPLASNVNYAAGAVVANNTATKLSSKGSVCVFTLAGSDLVVDVTGYVR